MHVPAEAVPPQRPDPASLQPNIGATLHDVALIRAADTMRLDGWVVYPTRDEMGHQ